MKSLQIVSLSNRSLNLFIDKESLINII